jgi:serine/threonine protein kinase
LAQRARWTAFLGDFGVAKVIKAFGAILKDETITKTGIAVGTYAYMAPEVWSNKPVTASDQYSLAVAVYEFLAGVRPFTGEFGEIAAGHITQLVPPLRDKQPQLPSHLCEAVHRALSKKPEERFGSCVEFAAAVLEGIPVPPRKEDVTRVMCPACRVMLDLDEKVAGKSGKCRACGAPVTVSQDLEAVWLLGESQAAAGQGDHKPPKTPSTFGNTGQESSNSSTAARSLKSVVLTDIVVPPAVIALVPEQVARTLGIFPVKIENGRLQVAIGDPVDGESHEKVRAKLKNPLVEFLYAPEWEIATAIRQHYTKQRDSLLVAPGRITESNTAAGVSDVRRESLGEKMWKEHEQPRLAGSKYAPSEHGGDYQGPSLIEVLVILYVLANLCLGSYQWLTHGWRAASWYFTHSAGVVGVVVVLVVIASIVTASQDKGS